MEAKCPICQEAYNTQKKVPRIVPECGHTFCEECIAQFTSSLFVCPIDNETHDFQNGENEMPRNMTLLKAIRKKEEGKPREKVVETKTETRTETRIDEINEFMNPYQMKTSKSGVKAEGSEYQSDVNLLNQEIVSKSKIIEESVQDIHKHLLSRIDLKFKVYYETMKKHQQFFVTEVNKLKDHYRSVLAIYQTEFNNHILQSHDAISSKSNQRIKELITQIQNSEEVFRRRVNQIKQNIDKKTQSLELVTITPSSTFISNLLSQDTQIKGNLNKSQVRFENTPRTYQNQLSIYSKPASSLSKRTHSRERSTNDFKIFIQRRDRNPSLITTPSKFEPNLRKPMKLLRQSNQQPLNGSPSHEYYDIGSPSMTPRKKTVNSSNRSFSSQKDKLEDRRRVDDLLEIILDSQSPNLELINMGVKDSYMRSIGECISRSHRKVGVLKLVKNLITDRGLCELLGELSDYPYMHTLNLTSNYLSDASLETILQFSKNNKMLTNYYVSNNNMTVPKGYRMLLNESGINVFL